MLQNTFWQLSADYKCVIDFDCCPLKLILALKIAPSQLEMFFHSKEAYKIHDHFNIYLSNVYKENELVFSSLNWILKNFCKTGAHTFLLILGIQKNSIWKDFQDILSLAQWSKWILCQQFYFI